MPNPYASPSSPEPTRSIYAELIPVWLAFAVITAGISLFNFNYAKKLGGMVHPYPLWLAGILSTYYIAVMATSFTGCWVLSKRNWRDNGLLIYPGHFLIAWIAAEHFVELSWVPFLNATGWFLRFGRLIALLPVLIQLAGVVFSPGFWRVVFAIPVAFYCLQFSLHWPWASLTNTSLQLVAIILCWRYASRLQFDSTHHFGVRVAIAYLAYFVCTNALLLLAQIGVLPAIPGITPL